MTAIAKIRQNAVAQAAAHPVLSPDLAALTDAVRQGVPMLARDLTPERVAEARGVVTLAETDGPAPEMLIAAWLKKLTALVVNPPTDATESANKTRAICEICGDFPAGVWTPETRKAWATQGPQGKFWPAPAELYAHLLPYAERLRRNVEGCRKIVRLAERAGKREEGISEDERKAVAAQMAAWRATKPDPEPERRRSEVQVPSVAERIAECRRQIEADPASAEWLLPMIERLQAQTMPKNSHSTRHSHPKPIGAYMAAGNHQRAM